MVNEAAAAASDMKTMETESKKLKTNYELKATLQEFEFVKVLNEDNQSKTIFIHAVKKNTEEPESKNRDAVIIFEKPHFGLDEVKSFLSIDNEFEIDLVNDIYNKLCIFPTKPYNSKFIPLGIFRDT